MITSALISECRREYGDYTKSSRAIRSGDGTSTVFNLGKFPVIEGSYSVYVNAVAQTEGSAYTLDKDTGDVVFATAPPSGQEVLIDFKYAYGRDQNWLENINRAIEALNSKGFFNQSIRDTSMSLSANITTYDCPSGCVDLYSALQSDNYTSAGNFVRLDTNWSYQEDANKLVLGGKPTRANYLQVSFLRKIYTYGTTSATLDIKDRWKEMVKSKAGSAFYRSLAGKIAKEGNASIDEGHFSFTNLRTMANDLDTTFEIEAKRAKPTRPAKEVGYYIPGGGQA